jgi:hypothetical protein
MYLSEHKEKSKNGQKVDINVTFLSKNAKVKKEIPISKSPQNFLFRKNDFSFLKIF